MGSKKALSELLDALKPALVDHMVCAYEVLGSIPLHLHLISPVIKGLQVAGLGMAFF